jgi:hypothetical protein
MRWTRRATDAGHRLVFAGDAEVSYPARPLGPLLKKQVRVGRGAPGVWRMMGWSRWRQTLAVVRGMLPMPPTTLPARVRQRGLADLDPPLVRLWLAVWLCKATRAAGNVRGLLGTG